MSTWQLQSIDILTCTVKTCWDGVNMWIMKKIWNVNEEKLSGIRKYNWSLKYQYLQYLSSQQMYYKDHTTGGNSEIRFLEVYPAKVSMSSLGIVISSSRTQIRCLASSQPFLSLLHGDPAPDWHHNPPVFVTAGDRTTHESLWDDLRGTVTGQHSAATAEVSLKQALTKYCLSSRSSHVSTELPKDGLCAAFWKWHGNMNHFTCSYTLHWSHANNGTVMYTSMYKCLNKRLVEHHLWTSVLNQVRFCKWRTNKYIFIFDVGQLLFTMDIWMRSLAFISMRWQ